MYVFAVINECGKKHHALNLQNSPTTILKLKQFTTNMPKPSK